MDTPIKNRRFFSTRGEAEKWERTLIEQRAEKKRLAEEIQQQKRDEIHEKEMEAFKGHIVEKSGEARVYKSKGHDDMPIFELTPENSKTHATKMFVDRKAKKFTKSVIKMHGNHYVVAPGTDIGLTGLKPENKMKDSSDGKVPLRRTGKAQKYAMFGPPLDKIAEALAKRTGKDIVDVRKRMGRDLDRLSRSQVPLQGEQGLPYSESNLIKMQEVAAIVRLDKGRVPKATRYIRQAFISGKSFTALLVDNEYVGAPKGGVAALRGKKVEGGDISDGSDIEDKLKSPSIDFGEDDVVPNEDERDSDVVIDNPKKRALPPLSTKRQPDRKKTKDQVIDPIPEEDERESASPGEDVISSEVDEDHHDNLSDTISSEMKTDEE